MSSALVKHQPSSFDRQIQTGLVFVRRAFLAKQERPVDQLDVDPAVLRGLDAVGDLNDLAGGLFGIGVRSVGRISYAILITRMGDQGRERNAPMRPSARSALPQPTDIVSATRHARSGLMHCDMIGETLA